MVAKFCSRSHGQPLPGVRSAVMISSRREISREGVMTHPKAGERICPITKTKANSKFTWVVDGKAYLFCCPPCVDEFLKTAKASSDPLAEPDSYVK